MMTTSFPRFPRVPRHQRGSTLTEALIAFLVLALGAVALARLHGQLRLDTDLARQRGEAARLAQDELDSVRATHPIASIASATRTPAGDTPYRVERTITATALAHAVAATVAVSWTDRRGDRQRLVLESLVDGSDPRLSGALALNLTAVALPPP